MWSFGFGWGRAMKNLCQLIFPGINITVKMIALNVLQEHTSLSRISLYIEIICLLPALYPPSLYWVTKTRFLNAPSQQASYEKQCITSTLLNIPFGFKRFPFQLFCSESKAKFEMKFFLFQVYEMGILSFPSISKWIKGMRMDRVPLEKPSYAARGKHCPEAHCCVSEFWSLPHKKGHSWNILGISSWHSTVTSSACFKLC